MAIRYILINLDGTIIPNERDQFAEAYRCALTAHMAPLGFEPCRFAYTLSNATAAMIKNDGCLSNEDVFFNVFSKEYGEDTAIIRDAIELFHKHALPKLKICCKQDPKIVKTINALCDMKYRILIASQPIFPTEVINAKIEWAGLYLGDIKYVTTSEYSSFCKPNISYYRQLESKIGIDASRCLVVSNNVDEDMIAEKVGMKVFLLTDNLINTHNADISRYRQGDWDALFNYLQKK